ncbi:hypothetical protein PIB30_032291 [Stylosanthes scabra]|uniref:Ubiquitin-like protease family profile domain-containing protein n=1 Tax=Stylosanthes scabra TaxID=79078 RepID=A0ABU6YCT2_9FABA|nr:hypothetical protein [Stylosanthes scabra]
MPQREVRNSTKVKKTDPSSNSINVANPSSCEPVEDTTDIRDYAAFNRTKRIRACRKPKWNKSMSKATHSIEKLFQSTHEEDKHNQTSINEFIPETFWDKNGTHNITPSQVPEPTPEMKVVGVELSLVAYIFGVEQNTTEILVQIDHCVGDRKAFQSIAPGKPIVSDVMTLVIEMLTHGSDHRIWFLPPSFSAKYIESMIQDNSWYDDPTHLRPAISTFDYTERQVKQQANDSMDCGVWVFEWMIVSHIWGTYEILDVNNYKRLRLAMDLVQ